MTFDPFTQLVKADSQIDTRLLAAERTWPQVLDQHAQIALRGSEQMLDFPHTFDDSRRLPFRQVVQAFQSEIRTGQGLEQTIVQVPGEAEALLRDGRLLALMRSVELVHM